MNRDLSLVDRIAGDRELIFEFLVVFARFEYALKRSGFAMSSHLRDGKRRPAEPDWISFSESIAATTKFSTITDPSFVAACHYLRNNPPKCQYITDGSLSFVEAELEKAPDETYVIRLVKFVRNNLFHGGKFPNDPAPDLARNGKLLEASLIILRQCLILNDPVRGAFEAMDE